MELLKRRSGFKIETTLAARLGMMGLLITLVMLLSASPLHAVSYTLTSDHCTGGCGTAPYGTVTLSQNGTTVDVSVLLATGYSFAKTGAADDMAFKFNGSGVALGDITVDLHVPALIPATGAFNGDGTGNFTFGISCPGCGPGGSNAFSTVINFHVASATIADLTVPNNLGNLFVADVLAPNGNTGPVDATESGRIPEPTSLSLIGLGLVAVCLKFRGKRTA